MVWLGTLNDGFASLKFRYLAPSSQIWTRGRLKRPC